MSDRKYRHRGYMDNNDREPQRSRPQSGPQGQGQQRPQDREGPRSPKMMAFGEAIKCANCGIAAPTSINFTSTCTKCKAELHSCRQCSYFDPSAHFECSNKKIAKRIVNKNANNVCELFAPRTVVERQTSSGAPTDARAAFAKLFKK